MSRLARLAAGLADPLLVTYGVNVRYLTGFESSNTAVLVEPDGEATLFTDFRYAEAARAVDAVTFVQTPRDVISALAGRLAGRRIAFEAARIGFAQHMAAVESGGARRLRFPEIAQDIRDLLLPVPVECTLHGEVHAVQLI